MGLCEELAGWPARETCARCDCQLAQVEIVQKPYNAGQ